LGLKYPEQRKNITVNYLAHYIFEPSSKIFLTGNSCNENKNKSEAIHGLQVQKIMDKGIFPSKLPFCLIIL
jgi:ATP sulfurylase